MHLKSVLDFGREWWERFLAVQAFDRAMALAAQAFGALIPLALVYSALAPTREGEDFADSLIDTLGLEGTTADSVRETFASSADVESSISLLGIFFVLVSALSFTRGMQRLYEGAYDLPPQGMRGTRAGLEWIAMICVYSTVRPYFSDLFGETVLIEAIASLALAGAVWTLTPFLLLGRRLTWKILLPGASLAAIGMTVYAATTVIWLPETIESSADQFGTIGVAFGILSWLFAAAVVLVVTTTGGALVLDRMRQHGIKPETFQR